MARENMIYTIAVDINAGINTRASAKLTISRDDSFRFNEIRFSATDDFYVKFKDSSSQKLWSDDFIHSSVLSSINWNGSTKAGLIILPMEKIITGNTDIIIELLNDSQNANKVFFAFNGIKE